MEFSVSPEERQILLADARESITAKLENRPQQYRRDPKPPGRETSVLDQPSGAFVTLHSTTPAGRRLRGCIGRMSAGLSLEKTVQRMALEAAFGDPRFPPLEAREFPHCSIEISVLSPMEPCLNPLQVQVGVHGLFLSHRGRSGVLLPQVPVQ